jgi:glycosyltransferase involved in cell wall biosynthesis
MTSETKPIYMVVPCYNEEKRLNLEYWNELIDIAGTKWIFVNDGSTDNTLNLLQGIKNASVISLEKNVGKAEAIRQGVVSTFEALNQDDFSFGYIDADGAFAVEDIRKLVRIAHDSEYHFEGIWGARVKLAGRNINRRDLRHILSRVIITIIGLKIKNLPYDLQTGLKIFKFNKESMTVFDKKFETRWFVDLEIYLRFKMATQRVLKIWEEPLNNWEDVSGSKVRGFQLVQIMRDLFRVIQISARTEKSKWT